MDSLSSKLIPLTLFRIGLGFILVGGVTSAGNSQTFVAPGDVGTIEYPLQNRSISDAALQDATLEYDAPAHFIVNAASIRGPHSLPPAETFSFIIEYEIAAGAPEGPFEITLKPRSPSSADEEVEVAPPLATLDTSVSLNIAGVCFLVENEKLIFSHSATRKARNPGFRGIRYCETRIRCITAGGLLPGVRI